MTGVEILAMEEVATEFIYNWSAFWIAFAVIFSVFLVVGVYLAYSCYDDSNIAIGVVFGLLFCIAFGAIFGDACGTDTAYKTKYKVIISDEVSMNEFLDRYEIIDQEGKIYTVMEKD